MGEAKKKMAAAREWRESLSPDEIVVADAATKLFSAFVQPFQAMGMCYRLTFFLAEYLQDHHGISVVPMVGYINDGEGDIMASHAWIELGGKKVDLALAFTEHPEAQLVGEVLILDRVTRPGVRYTYHRERSPEALRAIMRLRSDVKFETLADHKEQEHLTMKARAQNPDLRRAYLDDAPDGFVYDRLVKLME